MSATTAFNAGCSLAFIRIDDGRRGELLRCRGVLWYLARPHVLGDDVFRSEDAELLHEKLELLLERGDDRLLCAVRHVPHPLLEGADCFLASLVDKLLVGLARFALIRRVCEAEIANLPLHLLGQTR